VACAVNQPDIFTIAAVGAVFREKPLRIAAHGGNTRARRNQNGIIAGAFLPRRLDLAQHLADRIHHTQQCRGDLWGEHKLPVSQASQQVLAYMRHCLQLIEG